MDSNTQKKVLIFSRYIPPIYSGAGLQAIKHAEILNQNALPTEILTIRTNIAQAKSEKDQLGESRVNEIFYRKTLSRVDEIILSLKICQWLYNNRKNYDLYVFFGMGTIIYFPIFLLKILLKKKIVLRATLVGTDDLESISGEKLGMIKIRIILLADYYMAISKHIYQITQKTLKKYKTKMRAILIHNPVDYNFYSPINSKTKKKELREKYKLSDDHFVLITVGFFSERKKIDQIIKTCKELKSYKSNLKVLMLCKSSSDSFSENNNEYIEHCHNLVKEYELSSSVEFFDQGNVRDMLRASDIFLFASSQEGCPNALLEAKSIGLPVYAFQRDWLSSDIIENKIDGFILHNDDTKAMAELIIDTTSEHSFISENAKTQIKNGYDTTQVYKGYIDILSNNIN